MASLPPVFPRTLHKHRFLLHWLLLSGLLLLFFIHLTRSTFHRQVQQNLSHRLVSRSESKLALKRRTKAEKAHKWIRAHSNVHRQGSWMSYWSSTPKAALISLVRNEELDGILQSMRQLEYRWNQHYNYPWLFFSETPFTEEFKNKTSALTARASYHVIPSDHWLPPANISENRFFDSLDYLGLVGVGKGSLPSYRNMCRWNSGFFYLHPALAEYEFYWRVEPDVHFLCDIPYDPFKFMKENEMVYGWNMNILDDARSFPSLWRTTRHFIHRHAHLVHPDADLSWLVDVENGHDYNACQFFSNFEIGSLDFFRAEANRRYFDWLDSEEGGQGFYYERLGDAPVHTLSVALFAAREDTWFFRDIGYQHDIARHCPREHARIGSCDCQGTPLDENFYKLVPMESPQRKPRDTCVRMWLGPEWTEKTPGWNMDVEKAVGGSGYGGYVKEE